MFSYKMNAVCYCVLIIVIIFVFGILLWLYLRRRKTNEPVKGGGMKMKGGVNEEYLINGLISLMYMKTTGYSFDTSAYISRIQQIPALTPEPVLRCINRILSANGDEITARANALPGAWLFSPPTDTVDNLRINLTNNILDSLIYKSYYNVGVQLLPQYGHIVNHIEERRPLFKYCAKLFSKDEDALASVYYAINDMSVSDSSLFVYSLLRLLYNNNGNDIARNILYSTADHILSKGLMSGIDAALFNVYVMSYLYNRVKSLNMVRTCVFRNSDTVNALFEQRMLRVPPEIDTIISTQSILYGYCTTMVGRNQELNKMILDRIGKIVSTVNIPYYNIFFRILKDSQSIIENTIQTMVLRACSGDYDEKTQLLRILFSLYITLQEIDESTILMNTIERIQMFADDTDIQENIARVLAAYIYNSNPKGQALILESLGSYTLINNYDTCALIIQHFEKNVNVRTAVIQAFNGNIQAQMAVMSDLVKQAFSGMDSAQTIVSRMLVSQAIAGNNAARRIIYHVQGMDMDLRSMILRKVILMASESDELAQQVIVTAIAGDDIQKSNIVNAAIAGNIDGWLSMLQIIIASHPFLLTDTSRAFSTQMTTVLNEISTKIINNENIENIQPGIEALTTMRELTRLALNGTDDQQLYLLHMLSGYAELRAEALNIIKEGKWNGTDKNRILFITLYSILIYRLNDQRIMDILIEDMGDTITDEAMKLLIPKQSELSAHMILMPVIQDPPESYLRYIEQMASSINRQSQVDEYNEDSNEPLPDDGDDDFLDQ